MTGQPTATVKRCGKIKRKKASFLAFLFVGFYLTLFMALAARLRVLGGCAAARRRLTARAPASAATGRFSSFAASRAGFFRVELMRGALLMRGLASLAGYFTLLLFVHGSKTAFAFAPAFCC
jgi:hypothetical protein